MTRYVVRFEYNCKNVVGEPVEIILLEGISGDYVLEY